MIGGIVMNRPLHPDGVMGIDAAVGLGLLLRLHGFVDMGSRECRIERGERNRRAENRHDRGKNDYYPSPSMS